MAAGAQRELVHSVVVEFEDLDAYQVVHHTRWVAYLERARLRLLEALNLDLFPAEVMPVLHDLRVRFRRPARLGDQLRIAVFVQELDDYQVTLGYRITRETETLGRAKTTVAFTDPSGSLATMPETYLRALRTWSAGSRTESVAVPPPE